MLHKLYKVREYQEPAEELVFNKLLAEGYSESEIENLRDKICIGCNMPRDDCQCPYTGSSHPTTEERYEQTLRLIKRSKV